MIVDLLRNDISRISEVGTLDVPELFRDRNLSDRPPDGEHGARQTAAGPDDRGDFRRAVSRAARSPARRRSARWRSSARWRATPRDAYCGAIGWIAPGGPMRFNVAIRTISLFAGGEAVYNVGGGVVFDSDGRGGVSGMSAEGAVRDGSRSRLRPDRDHALGTGSRLRPVRAASRPALRLGRTNSASPMIRSGSARR